MIMMVEQLFTIGITPPFYGKLFITTHLLE